MNIIGQDHVLRYINQGLAKNQLSPSLLFVGPEGVGKATVAIEVAKAMACSSQQIPSCGQCPHCVRIQKQQHPDLLVINREIQATLLNEKPESQTGIKIESIRNVDKFTQLKPFEMGHRIVILEEAHKLTIEAANALLKTLEEPPNGAQLILLAVDERNLPSTILSRCALIRFKPIPSPLIIEWLISNHKVSRDQAEKVAEQAHGSFQKALEYKDESLEMMDLSAYKCDEYFDLLSDSSWRKQARERARELLRHLDSVAQRKLSQGDLDQKQIIELIQKANKQIDRHVSPKLVLENLYIRLEHPLTS